MNDSKCKDCIYYDAYFGCIGDFVFPLPCIFPVASDSCPYKNSPPADPEDFDKRCV